MAHNIQLNDAIYDRLIAEANERGFIVKPGPGSQTGAFIAWMLDNIHPAIKGEDTQEIWGRFAQAIMPLANSLAIKLLEHGKGLKSNFSAEKGKATFEQYDL